MKSISAMLVLPLLAACAARGVAPVPEASADPALLRTQREVWEVWYAGDTARLRALTPELIAINSGGDQFADQESMLRASARFHADGGRLISLTFPTMRIQRFGDVAIVYSTFRSVMLVRGDTVHDGGRATEVFVRRNGAWVNPGWHLDAVTPDKE